MKHSLYYILSVALLLAMMVVNVNTAYGFEFISNDSIPHKTDSISTKKCTDCHGALVEKQIKHVTKTDKGCADCHTPGSSDHPKTAIGLIQAMPDLCFSCHEERKKLITTAPFVHKVVNDKKSCTNCHSSHSTDEKGLLIAKRKDLCLSCHNKAIVVSPKKTLPDLDKLSKTAKTIHPPFKNCSKTCHNAHASQDPRLLDLAFPVNNYLPVSVDSFALCWECHEMDLVQKEKTTTTSFRNGDKNLHFVHIHGEKGRSCVVCHSPHATNNQFLIRDKVGFGSWEFRMNFQPTETGGSCAPACHQERKYTR